MIKGFNEYFISENLKYHIDNNLSLYNNVFRPGSDSFYALLTEARNLYNTKSIILEGIDKVLFDETDIGFYDLYEGENVPLDLPMFEDLSPQVNNDNVFSIRNKKEGDVVKVDGKDIIYIKPLAWIKDKTANCIKFEGEYNNSKVIVKYDYNCDSYITESKYNGKEVDLNKPMRSSGPKKYKVYVKNPKNGKIIKVNFGDVKGGLTSKINDPEARKQFADRHNCEMKKDKTKAGYWSCRLPRYAHLLGLKGGGNYWW